MEIYKGPHLVIKYEQKNSRLINTWKSNPPDDLAYRRELLEHLHIAKKIKPFQVMWLLESLTFKPSDVTKKWVHDNISIPIFKARFIAKNQDGFDQVVFVVGFDVLVYIEVMDIFNVHTTSSFKPKYFATEIKAENWLNEDLNIKVSKREDEKLTIIFKEIDDRGKAVFEFKEDASNFDSTINSFKTILGQSHFIKNNVEKYFSLTPREKVTLKLIVKGYTNEQISEKMYISSNTVRTHRNRIWKKLEIKQLIDCLRYQCFFD
tara:strand:- start:1500 stop:2288 length:789 start_codon:yes stop_codon:yes gene_type:complete